MPPASQSGEHHPLYRRASTSNFLPLESDMSERPRTMRRTMTAPVTLSRSVRRSSVLDSQLSRQVRWMVSVDTLDEEDDVEEPQCLRITEAEGPERDLSVFRAPSSVAFKPVLFVLAFILFNVAVLLLVAQPLLAVEPLRQASGLSSVLAAPGVTICIAMLLTALVTLFPFLNPGYLKQFEKGPNWQPNTELGFKRWCKICGTPKPDRTHHCRGCNRCVLVMDHHCPTLGNCVGHQNHRIWGLILFVCGLTTIHAELVIGATLVAYWPEFWRVWANSTTALRAASFALLAFLSCFVYPFWAFGLFNFCCFHCRLICANLTTIENLDRDEDQPSIFDKGGPAANVAAFITASRLPSLEPTLGI